ncbi:hypothetical protein QE422_001907 [Chryseobacterium sp. SORGH_AS 447]|uniref:hypothetical protein n=1 Tax=Chryseobacterium sp. SORGH_AS_0447 TaxID=3041769 RepID=UPI00278352B7|nr:hypothetical protein [Chryseobacterium sp. SORGH_AS_0447]MDQ1161539.1 hypothetical protein [Chryseobacterium sp. SORGH_AS_0447]
MKKLIPLFFILFFIRIFSQEYHFDYSIESQSNQTKPNKEKRISTSFYDSEKNVYLQLTKYDNRLRASIYDKAKHFRHSFKVTETKGSVIFEYTHTNDFSKSKNSSFSKNDIIEVNKIDSLHYEVIAFKNKKKTKRRLRAIVSLEKSKLNYLEIYIEHSKIDEMKNKIKQYLDLTSSNYIVTNIKLDYSDGYSSEISYKITKVDFLLKLPEKLVVKEYNFIGEFQD